MGINFRPRSFDEIFKTTSNAKIIVNYLDVFSEESKELIDKYIFKNYTEDSISLLPSCSCGELKGELRIGQVCGSCETHVVSELDEDINFLLYAKRPDGVEKFISPFVMQLLIDKFRIPRLPVSIIEYIADPSVRLKGMQPRTRTAVEKLDHILSQNNIERGYNSLVRNLYWLVEMLEVEFTNTPKKRRGEFLAFLKSEEANIFSDYLPFPNSTLLVMTGNSLGRFVDSNISKPVNCIRRMTGIDIKNKGIRSKQIRTMKTIVEMADFYYKYFRQSVFSKPGLIRKHISSTRSHFTARAVIISITEPHAYDEIHLPWSIAVTLLRPFLFKGLMKRGYSHREAVRLLAEYNRQYSPLLDEIFQEILVSSGGIVMLLNRNPSLHRGSMQRVVCTKIKTKTDDNTLSMSYLIAPAFNADFDGDALNLTLVLSENVTRNTENFRPYHSLLGFTGPNDFSGNIKFPKTITSTLANWYNS